MSTTEHADVCTEAEFNASGMAEVYMTALVAAHDRIADIMAGLEDGRYHHEAAHLTAARFIAELVTAEYARIELGYGVREA